MKPISMSIASAIAPLTPASIVDWSIAPGELEVEEAVHLGELRQVDGAAGAAGVDRQEQRREDDDRRQELRAAERLHDRAAPERGRSTAQAGGQALRHALVTRRLLSRLGSPPVGTLEVAAGLLDEHVVERRLHEVRATRRTAPPRRAPGRSARRRAAPCSSGTISTPSLDGQRLAEAGEDVLARRRVAAVGER